MRKKTKTYLGIVTAMALGLGAVSFAIGVAQVSMQAFMIAINVGFFSSAIGIFTGVLSATTSIVGYLKRRKAEKIQARYLAKTARKALLKNQDKDYASQISLADTKKFNKALVYSAFNRQSGMLGRKTGYGIDVKTVRIENKIEALKILQSQLNRSSSSASKSEKVDKKIRALQNKLASMVTNTTSTSDRYNYTFTVKDVNTGAEIFDHRNQISCLNSRTKNQFETLYKKSISAFNDRNIENYGDAIMINFNDGFKNTYVKTTDIERKKYFEYLLLKDAKNALDENRAMAEIVFPIKVVDRDYSAHKKFKSKELRITNEEQLIKKIKEFENSKDFYEISKITNEQPSVTLNLESSKIKKEQTNGAEKNNTNPPKFQNKINFKNDNLVKKTPENAEGFTAVDEKGNKLDIEFYNGSSNEQ